MADNHDNEEVPGPGSPASTTPQNGMGQAALVLGIIGLFTAVLGALIFPILFWAPSVLAVVFGAIGLRRAGQGRASNRGIALAGLVLGIGGLALGVGFLIVVVTAITSGS